MCLFVCQSSPVWTVWPLTLIFVIGVDLDLGKVGIVGQGRRSRSNAKKIVFWQHCDLALSSRSKVRVKVKGRVKIIGQGQISGTQQSILGARLCRVQQRAIRVITRIRFKCLCVHNLWAYADNCADAVDRLLIVGGGDGSKLGGLQKLLEVWRGCTKKIPRKRGVYKRSDIIVVRLQPLEKHIVTCQVHPGACPSKTGLVYGPFFFLFFFWVVITRLALSRYLQDSTVYMFFYWL